MRKLRYKTELPIEENFSEEIHSDREHRLLIERIQQRNWEEAGRDWKKYLSNVEWGELQPLPSPKPKVEKQSQNKFW